VKYQAVIFDLFGTLIDILSPEENRRTLYEMASILNAPDDEFHNMWGQIGEKRFTGVFKNLEEILRYICSELKIPAKEKKFKLARDIRLKLYSRALKPKREILTMLSQLKSEGYRIGIISNCSIEPAEIWTTTDFALLIDTVIFSSVAGIQKPDPRIYRLAVNTMSVKPEDCLYIDDNDTNLTTSGEVGLHPVLFHKPRKENSNIINDKPNGKDWHGPVISSLQEVINLLK
jgi:putative hydrolase of the HAD superfamily